MATPDPDLVRLTPRQQALLNQPYFVAKYMTAWAEHVIFPLITRVAGLAALADGTFGIYPRRQWSWWIWVDSCVLGVCGAMMYGASKSKKAETFRAESTPPLPPGKE